MEAATLNRLLRADLEASPLPNLRPLAAQTFKHAAKRRRLVDAENMLHSRPGDAGAAELWLAELLGISARQIEGRMSLGPTFKRAVAELDAKTLQALPETTHTALDKLTKLTPVPVPDVRRLAHALVIDGQLVAHLLGAEPKKQTRHADAGEAYRRLAAKLHPDKGGDAALMADVNALRDAARS